MKKYNFQIYIVVSYTKVIEFVDVALMLVFAEKKKVGLLFLYVCGIVEMCIPYNSILIWFILLQRPLCREM